LGPLTEARFRAARAAGEYESPAAYAFDALVELCRDSMAAAEGKCVDAASDRSTSAGSSAGVPGSGGSMPAGAGLSPSRGDALQDEAESDRADSRAARESAADRAGDERSPKRRTGRRRRGAPVKLLVRIDYDTWLRGVVREGETCELVGYGPVAVSAVRDLVDTGDPFVAAILTKGRELVGVAHLGRRPSAHQQSALEWLYPSCAVEDCSAQARLEADHRVDWARTHYTVLDLLDLLCHHHHALKTRENWALVAGSGKRAFVPPSDPRHPRHAGAAA
jgi:hypothetical protein